MPDLFVAQTMHALVTMGVVPADRMDAATHFVQNELLFLRQQPYDTLYAENEMSMHLPVATDIPRGARTVGYVMRDRTGRAELVDDDTDNLPTVSTSRKRYTGPLRPIGVQYEHSLEDLEGAIYAGVPLDMSDADAAAAAVSEVHDECGAFGDDNYGLVGFFNHPNIPVIAATGDWDGLTDDQVIADLARMKWTVTTNTKKTIRANAMVFDTTTYEKLNSRRVGDTNETLLSFFLRTNKDIQYAESSTRLDLADAEGDGPRIACYRRDPKVVQMQMAIPFEQLIPQARGLKLVTPCRGKTGGVVVRFPKGAVFMDGHNG